ncbi:MAG: MBL fold hydrolase [Promethearchaeota archaeon]|nr:MAG: MBL fold hydrolase [Candidatus Lokiarchaeota archaeon]
MNRKDSFKIIIIFDNKCVNEGYLSGFGFSALIYNKLSNTYLLFDTGGDGGVLLHNIRNAGVDPTQIAKVIVSHNHYDHAGGLASVYTQNPHIKLYIPHAIKKYKRNYPEAEVVMHTELEEIDEAVFVSGQFGTSIKEQALFCKTTRDTFVLLVGCTHPGLEQFIMKARQMGKIEAVIGGFHGFRKLSYLKGIDFIGACHCTSYMHQIHSKFPEQFKKVCVGDYFLF